MNNEYHVMVNSRTTYLELLYSSIRMYIYFGWDMINSTA